MFEILNCIGMKIYKIGRNPGEVFKLHRARQGAAQCRPPPGQLAKVVQGERLHAGPIRGLLNKKFTLRFRPGIRPGVSVMVAGGVAADDEGDDEGDGEDAFHDPSFGSGGPARCWILEPPSLLKYIMT